MPNLAHTEVHKATYRTQHKACHPCLRDFLCSEWMSRQCREHRLYTAFCCVTELDAKIALHRLHCIVRVPA